LRLSNQILWRALLSGFIGVVGLAFFWQKEDVEKSTASPEQQAQQVLACKNFADLHRDHQGMVWVPGGTAKLGDDIYMEEKKSTQKLRGFWMDAHEVTNQEFAEFVNATGYLTVPEQYQKKQSDTIPAHVAVFVFPNEKTKNLGGWRLDASADWRHPGGKQTNIDGKEYFPVTAITYEDAQAYANWKGRTLPSEAQWEWAARSASNLTAQNEDEHHQPKPQDANTFQGIFPIRNTADDGFVGLAPVACFTPNRLGLYDMLGNVWELTSDVWHQAPEIAANQQSSVDYPKRVGAVAQRVIKGGSYLCSSDYCMRYRPGARAAQDEDLGASHLGFRTIKYD
jgi:formylglycine-generating enzyme